MKIFLTAVVASLLTITAQAAYAETAEPPPPGADTAGSSQPLAGAVADLTMGSQPPVPAVVEQKTAPTGPLASTDSDWPGVTADIMELKRTSGDTLTLKFVINNNSDEAVDLSGYNFGEPGTADISNIGGTHILDPQNKKKYFVVRDSAGNCVCSNKLRDIAPGSKGNIWAKFPAPPANVSKVTVEIPHFMPADDVPIG